MGPQFMLPSGSVISNVIARWSASCIAPRIVISSVNSSTSEEANKSFLVDFPGQTRWRNTCVGMGEFDRLSVTQTSAEPVEVRQRLFRQESDGGFVLRSSADRPDDGFFCLIVVGLKRRRE